MATRGFHANTVIEPPASRSGARRGGAANANTERELVCQSFEALTARLRNVEQWIHACGEGKIALPPDAGHEARLALLEAKRDVGTSARH